MNQTITVTLQDGCQMQVPQGTTVRALWESLPNPPAGIRPVGAVVNQGIQRMMQEHLMMDGKLAWIDQKSVEGYHIWRQSVILILLKASFDLFRQRRMIIQHTISNGVFCEFEGMAAHPGDEELLVQRMQEIIDKNYPIRLCEIETTEAARIFEKQGHFESVELMRLYPEERVNLVELDGYYDYFFYDVVDHTGMLAPFQLTRYEKGFILQTPEPVTGEISSFREQRKLHNILENTAHWANMMKVSNIAELNHLTCGGRFDELIQVSEALHEKRIAQIADNICSDPRVRLIMIAGPSSSGKTSFAQRLSIQLRVNGKKPMAISMDNYFVDRDKTPRDEDGEYDFENLEALQVDLFNQHLVQLLKGEPVQMPVYDFIQGKSSLDGPWVQLEPGQPLIIEGIHGLNDRLTFLIPRNVKRLIYVSALTQLNLNDSNSILTSDCRLLRRIVRDSRTRGHNVRDTIKRWDSVRRGERKNIFVYQENADLFFNSELVYELAVLKPMVEPLLASIGTDEPEYIPARRLLKFLHYVLPVENPRVPYHSLMREFIGGSWFHVE